MDRQRVHLVMAMSPAASDLIHMLSAQGWYVTVRWATEEELQREEQSGLA